MRVGVDCRELTKAKPSALAKVLLSIMRANPEHEFVLFSDVPLRSEYFPEGSVNIVHGRKNNGQFDVIRYQYWLAKAADQAGLDLFYEVDHYALFAARRTRWVTTIHDVYVLEGLERYPLHHTLAYRMFTRATLRNSDLVTTDTEFTKSRVEHFFGRSPKVRLLPIGVDGPHDPGTASLDLVSGPYLLALGRLSKWKGSVRLAELFVKHLAGTDLKLVFAGRCDPREADTQAAIERYARDCDEIVWLDYVSDDEREILFRNTKLLCYPSIYDGFGLPPVEAAVRGVPCLMSDLPVLREVTKSRGLYCDYFGDDETVIARIRDLLEQPVDATRLEELRAIGESYVWRGFVDKMAELADEVLRAASTRQGSRVPFKRYRYAKGGLGGH